MTSPANNQTNIRLSDSDKAKIDAVRERFGLPSRTSAIRYAVECLYREIAREGKSEIPGE